MSVTKISIVYEYLAVDQDELSENKCLILGGCFQNHFKMGKLSCRFLFPVRRGILECNEYMSLVSNINLDIFCIQK